MQYLNVCVISEVGAALSMVTMGLVYFDVKWLDTVFTYHLSHLLSHQFTDMKIGRVVDDINRL